MHGNPLYSSENVFEYTPYDQATDQWGVINNTYSITNRLIGSIQLGSGIVGAVGASAATAVSLPICIGTGVGCVATAAAGTFTGLSIDNAYTGGQTLWTGDLTPTLTNTLLQNLGLSPGAAAITEMALNLGTGAGATSRAAIEIKLAAEELQVAVAEVRAVRRPTAAQSELDVGVNLGTSVRPQVSYIDGHEVPYGTLGSVRPDFCMGLTCSFEVKNYNIATNSNGLINNVAQQAIDRAVNLPQGMIQTIIIDIRGQAVTDAQRNTIIQGIVQRSNGIINPTSIEFMTK